MDDHWRQQNSKDKHFTVLIIFAFNRTESANIKKDNFFIDNHRNPIIHQNPEDKGINEELKAAGF